MKLFGYFRSSAAYRVRIALNLKAVAYEDAFIHLVRDGGEHLKADYLAINPQGRVPSLQLDDGTVLIQSPAILEYIEETYREPALLPSDPVSRSNIRSAAALIGCDIHPLNNLSTMNYLRDPLGHDGDDVKTWYRHWVDVGFSALEQMLSDGPYAFGETVTMADVYLVPQVYNARRFEIPLQGYPRIVAADAACAKLEAFQKAHPAAQADAQ